MKKICICALALFATLAIQAQNKKGNWLLGAGLGSTGFSFGKSESGMVGSTDIGKSDNNSFSISINPTAGYYLSDNVVIGTYFNLGYFSNKYENSNNNNTNTSESKNSNASVGLGPFARFYFGGNGGKGMPFAEANVGISFYPGYKGEYIPNTGTGYTYTYNNYRPFNAGARIGYEHFLNSFVGLQYYVGYNHSSYDYEYTYDFPSSPDQTYTYKSSSNSITFGVGLQVHLDCKKKDKK
jgi:hypothetical protein